MANQKKVLKIEVHEREPEGFSPRVQVSGCYLEIDGKLLILQRAAGGLEPGTWGVPAGKLEKNETPEDAAIRELFEETGIFLDGSSRIERLCSLYVRKPEVDYVYHLFKVCVDRISDIRLSSEHQNYKWASSKDLEEMPLMAGAHESLQWYRAMLNKLGRNR